MHDPLFLQVPGTEFYHVAGADQQCRFLGELGEDLLRQADRRIGHGDRARADGGIGAHLLGDGEGVLKQPVQELAGCTGT